ncbi:MAG: hypothetical protein PHG65_11880, partial [Kiritimatiellae bacterium]|nr:hypothetical protein [Kiritimatiellia bacterium]
LGANCILLPDLEDAAVRLDQVAAAGLQAAIRLTLKGTDPDALRRQSDAFSEQVSEWKYHPAVMMWVVTSDTPGDTNVYAAMNRLAHKMRVVDEAHVAAFDAGPLDGALERAVQFAKACPNVDLLAGSLGCTVTNLTAPLNGSGWAKPFILYGSGRTGPAPEKYAAWGAAVDGSTKGRAGWMVERLTATLDAAKGRCLGTFFFTWDKEKALDPNWAALRYADGSASPWLDAVSYAWRGRTPAGNGPVIHALNAAIKGRITMPGTLEKAEVLASDPDGDSPVFAWTLYKELLEKAPDGFYVSRLEPVSARLSNADGAMVSLLLPDEPGTYRLQVAVNDQRGRSVQAGIPFLVQSVRRAPPVPLVDARAVSPSAKKPTATPVTVANTNGPRCVTIEPTSAGGWQMKVDGLPYFVKGAGGRKQLEELTAAGANTIRTWSTDAAHLVLDAAHRQGLKVCLGLWMKQERHRFDYTQTFPVEAQLKKLRAAVRRYKDHPALLMWACGCEVEWGEGTNTAVYRAINDIAAMVHQEDTNHPTTTAFADLGANNIKAALAAQYCPELDIFGVNSYGGLGTMADRLREVGWSRPYMITEFGPKGQWESPQTSWGAEIEQMPLEKARFYEESYQRSISSQENWCLGSFVFSWDYKMECTPTWYSMHLREGTRMNTADTMWRAWSGTEPPNRCPEITWIGSPLNRAKVAMGKSYTRDVDVKDPDGDPLTYQWELMSEIKKTAPDSTIVTELKPVPGRLKKEKSEQAFLTTPSKPGAYRIFVYVYDGQGNASGANMPFFVEEP